MKGQSGHLLYLQYLLKKKDFKGRGWKSSDEKRKKFI